MKTIKCKRCGNKVEVKNYNQKFCERCLPLHQREKQREWEQTECRKESHKKWSKEHRDKCNISYRKWAKAHPKKKKETYNRWARESHRKKRIQALIHYGGNPPKCMCCEESHIEFLVIDHIKGGGNKHRKSMGNIMIPEWLYRNNYPQGFRVLCQNCNASLTFYGYSPLNKDFR